MMSYFWKDHEIYFDHFVISEYKTEISEIYVLWHLLLCSTYNPVCVFVLSRVWHFTTP